MSGDHDDAPMSPPQPAAKTTGTSRRSATPFDPKSGDRHRAVVPRPVEASPEAIGSSASQSFDSEGSRNLSLTPRQPSANEAGRDGSPAARLVAVGPGRAGLSTFLLPGSRSEVRGFPIAEYKIEPPSLPDGTLRRDRLLDRLSAAASRRVIVIAAEAGYGKTTLLADWSRRAPLRTAWYRIDESDRDWITFLRYLVAAGRTCEQTFAPTTGDLIADVAATGLTMEEIVGVFVRELEGLAEPRTVLVLDDYHLVDDVPDIRTIMREVVRRSPPGLTVVISGRRTPRVPLARLRTLGDLAELSTDDLRFSRDETERLFRESYHRPLAGDVLETLCRRTEGWAATLQLVEAATRDRTPEETRSFIVSLSGSKTHLYEFLAEEVVGVLSPDLQRFLMETAVLQRVEPALAAVATERPVADVEPLLQAATRAGLLPPVDSGDRPQRYHPLVAEFLLSRLAGEIGQAGVGAIHRRVARHVEGSDWRLACHHYAAAGDHEAARRVAEGALQDIMASGDYAFAERYLGGDDGGDSVALDIVRSRLDFNKNDTEGALARARSAAANPPPHLRDAALANLMTLTFATGAIDESRELALALYASDSPHYRQLAEGTITIIDVGRGAVNLEAAAELMRRMAEAQRSGMPRYLGITLNNLMSLLRGMGRASEALQHADEAERALLDGGPAPEVADVLALRAWAEAHLGRMSLAQERLAAASKVSHLAVLADVLVQAADTWTCYGDAAQAEDCLRAAEPLARRISAQREMWYSARLWLALRLRDYDAASRYEARLEGIPTYNPAQQAQTAALRAHLALLRGEPDCFEQVRDAGQIAELQSARFWSRYCWILLAALEGGQALNRTITMLEGEDRAMVSVLAELFVDHLSELDAAALSLVTAEAELRPERWRQVLRHGTTSDDPRQRLLAGRLLDRVGELEDVPRLRALSRSLKGAHADALLGRGLAKRLAPPAFVDDLGSITIHVGSRTIHGAHIRRKPLALLCFLLSRPDWRVARDQVIDALWPDCTLEDALNSLNQTLYFLRRLIDPTYREDVSPAYVLNSGELVWLDGDLIESRSRRARRLARELARRLDLDRVQEFLEEYRGQFALDFAYEEWALAYRDSLHAAFLDITERAIQEAVERGAYAHGLTIARRALEIDPEADQVELGLIRLYRLTGATAAAAEQYAHYAAAVRRELGVEPPPLESL